MAASAVGIISPRTCMTPGHREKKFLKVTRYRTGIEPHCLIFTTKLAGKITGGVEMLNAHGEHVSDAGSHIDTARYLNDVELAEALLQNGTQNGGKLSFADIVFSLRNFLKMKYYPVAVKYFFSENEFEDFKKNANYKIALRPYTFCHFVAASRQRGDIVLGTSDKVGCSNAKYVMGWKELDDAEIKSHLKYTKDWDQANVL